MFESHQFFSHRKEQWFATWVIFKNSQTILFVSIILPCPISHNHTLVNRWMVPLIPYFIRILNSLNQLFCINSQEYKITNAKFLSKFYIVYICWKNLGDVFQNCVQILVPYALLGTNIISR